MPHVICERFKAIFHTQTQSHFTVTEWMFLIRIFPLASITSRLKFSCQFVCLVTTFLLHKHPQTCLYPKSISTTPTIRYSLLCVSMYLSLAANAWTKKCSRDTNTEDNPSPHIHTFMFTHTHRYHLLCCHSNMSKKKKRKTCINGKAVIWHWRVWVLSHQLPTCQLPLMSYGLSDEISFLWQNVIYLFLYF